MLDGCGHIIGTYVRLGAIIIPQHYHCWTTIFSALIIAPLSATRFQGSSQTFTCLSPFDLIDVIQWSIDGKLLTTFIITLTCNSYIALAHM